MKNKKKNTLIIAIALVLIISSIKISFATALEDNKFIQMIEGLDRKTIENEKKKLKKD